MDERNSESNRAGDSAKSANRQPKFDPAKDDEKQRSAWANLAAIQAGLDSIAAGIQNAEDSDRRVRHLIEELERQEPELKQKAGRSQPEVEISGNTQNSEQQGGRADSRPKEPDRQRRRPERELEL